MWKRQESASKIDVGVEFYDEIPFIKDKKKQGLEYFARLWSTSKEVEETDKDADGWVMRVQVVVSHWLLNSIFANIIYRTLRKLYIKKNKHTLNR